MKSINNSNYLQNVPNISPAMKDGIKFKKQQEKFTNHLDKKKSAKTREGYRGFSTQFQNAEQSQQLIDENNFSQRRSEISRLRSDFENTLQETVQADGQLKNAVNNYLTRVEGNPYLGKNIVFTNGATYYVTQQGVANPFTSWEIFDGTRGKNGCPFDAIPVNIPLPADTTPGTKIPELNLVFGSRAMQKGQSCSNSGKNVFVNELVNDPNENYLGCFRDKPPGEDIMFVPKMNSSNNVNGFTSRASSVFQNNNNAWGPWAAFDGNVGTWWHSETSRYDRNSGAYLGNVSLNYTNAGVNTSARGEWLVLDSTQPYVLTKYDVQGRQNCCGDATTNGRNPGSWVILGADNSQQFELIDTQTNQSLGYGMKTFYVKSSKPYNHFVFLTTVCGDSDNRTGHRTCVQIAHWNLYTSTTFSETGENAMQNAGIGQVDYESCRTFAMRNGYSMFGLQQTNTENLGQCVVSDDITTAKMYGNSKNFNMIPLWSSGTAGKGVTRAFVSHHGMLLIEAGGTTVWAETPVVAACSWGGFPNPDTVQASFGGNCVGKPKNIDCGNPSQEMYQPEGIVGNLNTQFSNAIRNNPNTPAFSYSSLSNWEGGDPAVCCVKNTEYSYQCGGGPFKENSIYSGGNATFDCTAEVAACRFELHLQTDGNMCIYQMSNGTMTGIWCTMTNGQQQYENPEWVASKGKYSRTSLLPGEYLAPGEWMGNDTGTLQLILQNDGNLVLYTSEYVPSCRKNTENKKMGINWMNALYEFIPSGIMENLGKLGFVDDNNVLYEYPEENVKLSKEYYKIPDMDSAGHDIPGAMFGGGTVEQCYTSCNDREDCYGFVFDNRNGNCWPKTNGMYPNGALRPFKNVDTFTRGKGPITPPVGVTSEVENIDTIQYQRYPKKTNLDKRYGLPEATYDEINQSEKVQNRMQKLSSEMGQMTDKFMQGTNQAIMQNKSNADALQRYQRERDKIEQKIKNMNVGSKEFTFRENFVLRNNVDQIVEDSKIVTIQKNYEYIYWTLLATGTVLVALNIK
jgi:hypothetical protein